MTFKILTQPTYIYTTTNRTSPKGEAADELGEVEKNERKRADEIMESSAQPTGEQHPKGIDAGVIATHFAQDNLKMAMHPSLRSGPNQHAAMKNITIGKGMDSCQDREDKNEESSDSSKKPEKHALESNGTVSRAEPTPDPADRPEEREFRIDEARECRKCGVKLSEEILSETTCPKNQRKCPEFLAH